MHLYCIQLPSRHHRLISHSVPELLTRCEVTAHQLRSTASIHNLPATFRDLSLAAAFVKTSASLFSIISSSRIHTRASLYYLRPSLRLCFAFMCWSVWCRLTRKVVNEFWRKFFWWHWHSSNGNNNDNKMWAGGRHDMPPPPANWQYLRIYSPGGTYSGMSAI